MRVATEDLPRTAAHPFYTRLNHNLETHDIDEYVEVAVGEVSSVPHTTCFNA
jgi:hypothetical protein